MNYDEMPDLCAEIYRATSNNYYEFMPKIYEVHQTLLKYKKASQFCELFDSRAGQVSNY